MLHNPPDKIHTFHCTILTKKTITAIGAKPPPFFKYVFVQIVHPTPSFALI